MPFGPKRTVGISGHCSEAWAIAPPWFGVEACGSQWKPVEAVEVIGKQWKTCGRQERGQKKCGRDGKAQEGNAMLQYLPLKAKPSRPKHHAVINKVGRNKSLVLHTHHHPK